MVLVFRVTIRNLASTIQPKKSNVPQVGQQTQMVPDVFTYTMGMAYIPPLDENIQMQQSVSLLRGTSSKSTTSVQSHQMQTQFHKSKQAILTTKVHIPTFTFCINTNTH